MFLTSFFFIKFQLISSGYQGTAAVQLGNDVMMMVIISLDSVHRTIRDSRIEILKGFISNRLCIPSA